MSFVIDKLLIVFWGQRYGKVEAKNIEVVQIISRFVESIYQYFLFATLLIDIWVNSLKLLYTYRLSGADKIDIGFITEDLQGSFFVTKDVIRKII